MAGVGLLLSFLSPGPASCLLIFLLLCETKQKTTQANSFWINLFSPIEYSFWFFQLPFAPNLSTRESKWNKQKTLRERYATQNYTISFAMGAGRMFELWRFVKLIDSKDCSSRFAQRRGIWERTFERLMAPAIRHYICYQGSRGWRSDPSGDGGLHRASSWDGSRWGKAFYTFAPPPCLYSTLH